MDFGVRLVHINTSPMARTNNPNGLITHIFTPITRLASVHIAPPKIILRMTWEPPAPRDQHLGQEGYDVDERVPMARMTMTVPISIGTQMIIKIYCRSKS